jgi:hypothetical protein
MVLETAIKKAQLRNIVTLINEGKVELFWLGRHIKVNALTCALEACQWQSRSWTGRGGKDAKTEYTTDVVDYKAEFDYLTSKEVDPLVRKIYQLLTYLYEAYYIPPNPDEKHHNKADSDLSPVARLFRKSTLPDPNDILSTLREVILIYLLVHQQDLLACCPGYKFPLFLPGRDEHLMVFLRGIYIDALLQQSEVMVDALDSILQQSLPRDKMNTNLANQLLLVACKSDFNRTNKLVWQLLVSEFALNFGKVKVYGENITALIYVLRYNNYFAATQLLQHGADPCLAVEKITPLYMFMITLGKTNISHSDEQIKECLSLLLAHGGKLQLKTPWMSCLDHADFLPRQIKVMDPADRKNAKNCKSHTG